MNIPYTFDLAPSTWIPSRYDNHIIRKLSSMKGQYYDTQAFDRLLAQSDPLLYEVYELSRPSVAGELLHGISIIHPGKVGNEYYMTKGHFHAVLDTAELYYCLGGNGMMVMETPEGDWAVEGFTAGKTLYIPPRWAHRSVNVGDLDLALLFIYPGHAGHDYGTIERQGFRKLVLDEGGEARVVDNPRWVHLEQIKSLLL